MPAQELFMDAVIDGRKVQVVKTFDRLYAQEAFGEMSDEAKAFLWRSLKPEDIYDPAGLPTEPGIEYDTFLLDELLDQGREEWNSFSYFVVLDERSGRQEPTFVSPDWPTAEAFANGDETLPLERLPRSPGNAPSSGPR